MDELIRDMMEGKRVLLLGFGREGQGSYDLIRRVLPDQLLTIADASEAIRANEKLTGDPLVTVKTGAGYLEGIGEYDVIVKSPGISLKDLAGRIDPSKITSQTDLFLRRFSGQVIGVTGTKGKSTTASLISHILTNAGRDAILLGNIGTPAFHFIDRITPGTLIVFELSSHQLQHVVRSPHIAVLLNLYQEHLDAYRSYEEYRLAKMNIMRFQQADDYFIYNADDPLVVAHAETLKGDQSLVPFSLQGGGMVYDFHNRYLRGDHNRRNVLAAVAACRICGVDDFGIDEGLDSFKGLAHRMEYVGEFHGILFYDDSIATIPEACMAAVRAIPDVDTLVLGGFDRGVEYGELAGFLLGSGVQTFLLTGMAGARIAEEMERQGSRGKRVIRIRRFDEFLEPALKYTRPGHVCLLSPAAASYDEFRSFEERGMRFVQLVQTNNP